jgi:hypothetical protein
MDSGKSYAAARKKRGRTPATDNGQSSGRGRTPTRRQHNLLGEGEHQRADSVQQEFFFKIWEWAHIADSLLPIFGSDTMKTIRKEENWN